LCLIATIESPLNARVNSVTGLGCNIDNRAYEKYRIKRVNRLCGNVHLQQGILIVYRHMCAAIVSQNKQPITHVDW
jgi:hypothetical protein